MHDPGPQTSTASRPGAATGRSLRRTARGLPSVSVVDRPMNHRGSLLNPSGHGPHTALAPRWPIASALAEGRAILRCPDLAPDVSYSEIPVARQLPHHP